MERGGQSGGERWERIDVIPLIVRDVTKRRWFPGGPTLMQNNKKIAPDGETRKYCKLPVASTTGLTGTETRSFLLTHTIREQRYRCPKIYSGIPCVWKYCRACVARPTTTPRTGEVKVFYRKARNIVFKLEITQRLWPGDSAHLVRT